MVNLNPNQISSFKLPGRDQRVIANETKCVKLSYLLYNIFSKYILFSFSWKKVKNRKVIYYPQFLVINFLKCFWYRRRSAFVWGKEKEERVEKILRWLLPKTCYVVGACYVVYGAVYLIQGIKYIKDTIHFSIDLWFHFPLCFIAIFCGCSCTMLPPQLQVLLYNFIRLYFILITCLPSLHNDLMDGLCCSPTTQLSAVSQSLCGLWVLFEGRVALFACLWQLHGVLLSHQGDSWFGVLNYASYSW